MGFRSVVIYSLSLSPDLRSYLPLNFCFCFALNCVRAVDCDIPLGMNGRMSDSSVPIGQKETPTEAVMKINLETPKYLDNLKIDVISMVYEYSPQGPTMWC